jgi:TonB family protein
MAPILKELEAPIATPTASATAALPAKPANETPTRPQPVALEIPVTVNGARTVDGSDKRAPFSESTQTVLVFSHGAVIRIATPLVPGQLVFLTNEKTKKEVVCQVVKSKASTGAGAYVELQFTEPSIGFWGLQIPSGSTAPPAPRPVAPAHSAGPKPPAPAPVAIKPPIPATPKQSAPAVISVPPVKPAIAPPPPPVVHPAPTAVHSEPTAPPVTVLSTPVATASPEVAAAPPAPAAHHPVIPVPPIRDYSKQIDALFSVPQAPAPPAIAESHPVPAPEKPSTEDLKLQAARLQAQLSSLLFTETPASQAPPASTVTAKQETPVAEVANKILELTHNEPKSLVYNEPKSVRPAQKSPSGPLGADEEVKIPSWLAPISQNSETTAAESGDATEAAHDHSVSVNSEESFDALVADVPHRPQTAVFGGQLLGESSAATSETSSAGSIKGLFFGIAALLIVGIGGWYYYQSHSSAPLLAGLHSNGVPASTQPASSPTAPAAPAISTPEPTNVHSSAAPSAPPVKNSSPATNPEVSAPVPQRKNPNSASKNVQPDEAPAKPSLGDVHLGAPVVNHSAGSQQEGDALQSIDTKTVPGNADALSGAVSSHTAPAAPLPIGGDVTPAKLIKSVPPEYPAIAKSQHVSGRVQIDALIDASGNVASVKIISGPILLHRAALDAVKQWKYTPAQLDGQATSMHLTVNVEFHTQ